MMNRIKIYSILLCILCLLPVLTQAQTLTQYEYWFDDDFANRQAVSLSGANATIDVDIDASSLGTGLHRFHLRFQQSDGMYSAVTSNYFFKAQMSEGGILEYWFDDNKDASKKITGQLASDGKDYVFNTLLDVTDISMGSHRFYYRVVNTDGTTCSPVSMTPVMLHSRYNVKAEDLKVTQYSIQIDDEEPLTLDVLTPKAEITIPYTMDARDLSVGDHTINLSFQNSINTKGSVSQAFKVNEIVIPTLELKASETDGLVQLIYNVLPNERRSRIMRVNSDGAKVKVVENRFGSPYILDQSYTDAPPAGDYTYYVQTVYEDAQGENQVVKSNEVNVHVEKAQDELSNCGYITGMIARSFVSPKSVLIKFSDGVTAVCYEGMFRRERIPKGTVLTLEVLGTSDSSLELTYEPVTVTIKSGENSIYIKGLTAEDMAPNNYYHDLVFASDMEWIGSEFKFLVKNWTKKTWKGKVRFRAISQKKAEEEENNTGNSNQGDDNSAGVEAGSIAPIPDVAVQNNYYYASSDEITLMAGETAPVTLSLENVFPDNKKDYYLFYIESDGGWTTGPDQSKNVKPVAINYDFNVTKNPMVRLIDKSSLEKAKDAVLMEDVEAAANLLLMVCGKIEAFDGFLGNLQEFTEQMLKETQKMAGVNFTLDKYNKYLEHALETESFEELLADEMVMLIPKAVIGQCGNALLKQFRENVKSDMLEGAWQKVTIKDVTAGVKFINDYLGKAMKVVKAIETYKDWKNMSTYEKHFYCAEAIINYVDKSSPFSQILKTYLDVARAYINKALEYGEAYYGQYESIYLYENIPSAKESEKFDYNKFVDFKIEVETSRLVDFNFAFFGTSAIRDVKVMLSNRQENQVDTVYFQPIGVWDGVMLKQTRYVGKDPMSGGGNIDVGYPLKRIWMEIKWQNGRISKVPLLNRKNKTNGVELVISPTSPYKYVIRFKSGSYRYENMADIIELKE